MIRQVAPVTALEIALVAARAAIPGAAARAPLGGKRRAAAVQVADRTGQAGPGPISKR